MSPHLREMHRRFRGLLDELAGKEPVPVPVEVRDDTARTDDRPYQPAAEPCCRREES